MLICVDCGERFNSWPALAHHQLHGPCRTPNLAGWVPRLALGGAPVDPDIIARVVHEANRALQHALGDPVPSPDYDHAPDWQAVSLREGVAAALHGIGPQELHEQWMGDKFANGWTYGPEKDPVAKTHPCLVPYDELPTEQRAKNDLFLAIVEALR
jgi:hypothetical protein